MADHQRFVTAMKFEGLSKDALKDVVRAMDEPTIRQLLHSLSLSISCGTWGNHPMHESCVRIVAALAAHQLASLGAEILRERVVGDN